MAKTMSMGDAAKALGVSVDTLRRWDAAGKIRTRRDSRNHRVLAVSEVTRLAGAAPRHRTGPRARPATACRASCARSRSMA